jgi:hypothetical protein
MMMTYFVFGECVVNVQYGNNQVHEHATCANNGKGIFAIMLVVFPASTILGSNIYMN